MQLMCRRHNGRSSCYISCYDPYTSEAAFRRVFLGAGEERKGVRCAAGV